MTLQPLNCPNCGGTVDRERMICEYCGTKFENTNQQVLRIEQVRNDVRILGMATNVGRELLHFEPDVVMREVKKQTAEQLADKLLEGDLIEFSTHLDFEHCQEVIQARLRVLDPHYRF